MNSLGIPSRVEQQCVLYTLFSWKDKVTPQWMNIHAGTHAHNISVKSYKHSVIHQSSYSQSNSNVAIISMSSLHPSYMTFRAALFVSASLVLFKVTACVIIVHLST